MENLPGEFLLLIQGRSSRAERKDKHLALCVFFSPLDIPPLKCLPLFLLRMCVNSFALAACFAFHTGLRAFQEFPGGVA